MSIATTALIAAAMVVVLAAVAELVFERGTAKLEGAKFEGAKLEGAKLGGAKLGGAKLKAPELDGRPVVWVVADDADLSEAYVGMCVDSVRAAAKDKHQVVIAHDGTFASLIPGWKVELATVPEPTRTQARTLASWKLLYYYGGVVVPASTVFAGSVDDLVARAPGLFAVERPRGGAHARVLGAEREHPAVRDMVREMELNIARGAPGEDKFDGVTEHIVSAAVAAHGGTLLDGEVAGLRDVHGEPVTVDALFDGVAFADGRVCVVIPADQVRSRKSMAWFAQASPRQVASSRSPMCRLLHRE